MNNICRAIKIMKISHGKAMTIWNVILLCSTIFTVFVAPCFPGSWEIPMFKTGYTLIFISAIYSIENHRRFIFIATIIALLIEWISLGLNLKSLMGISKLIKIIFFSFMVFALISHLVTSRKVTPRVIIESISGYLLLGLVYYIFVSMIMTNDPAAFHFPAGDSLANDNSHLSNPLYFGLITMSTTGFGDIVPVKPYARSLATWISISGQLYIAIIVALLVGKFASRQSHDEAPNK